MSSADERSPKRQRRSFSPASPPTSAPASTKQHSSIQTPPPSVHGMSPPLLPGLGMQGGDSKKRKRDEEDDDDNEEMTDTPQPIREAIEDDVEMAGDTEHRRSDHERNEGEDAVPPLPDAGIASTLYKLSIKPIAPSQPPPNANLLQLYDLTRIQASVARKDAVTGEKINKLRSSYTGKIKDLGLEGRNKASKNQYELLGLLHPDWDRDGEDPHGKTLWDERMGAATEDLMSGGRGVLDLLDGALGGMRPGRLPKDEHEHWKGLLGLDDTATVQPPTANKPLPSMAPNATAPKTAAKTNLLSKTAPMRNSAPSSPRNSSLLARPERTGKKRRYDESSYEGYEEDGYSTGGVDDTARRGSGGKRQKRKDFPPTSANSPPFSTSNPATGGGGGGSMIGVRSS